MRGLLLTFVILLCSCTSALAQTDSLAIDDTGTMPIVVDRVSRLTPMHKGEYVGGISASFSSFSSDNSEYLLLLQSVDASGSISSVKPSVGYFYSDSSMAGLRFSYTNVDGSVDSATLDMGSVNDLSLDVPYFSLGDKSFAFGLFHRSYTKLDAKGQFELFSEIELLYSYGTTTISQDITSTGSVLRSKHKKFSVGFSPGLAVNITPNVATFVSFGLGGLTVNNIKQYDQDWEYIGQRTASKLNLTIDLFAINFGITFHFWNSKE